MVNIEIDGRKIQARDGAMLIEAADEAGIPIPRFCYHKKLSVAANCRMCLVEVEKAGKPLPACATPVTDGMRVYTQSPKALDAQKGVMEFLLINHPLDCPICDQGGECDLQDLAMGYGASHSRFGEAKRVVTNKNLGPLIATDMTRCIHCTRCVRFGQEIAGIKELGATGRGEHMEINTYLESSMGSEMSGNVIDLCPVGALTSKPYRYSARPWELQTLPSVAPHDCVGSNVFVQTKANRVKRVLPRENETINEVWLSDRDRFSYEGTDTGDRLKAPRIKRNGKWEEVAWDEALDFVVRGLKSVVMQRGAGQLGALAHPSSTLEEIYLLQKLMRGMGSANIDHRLHQQDFSDQDIAPAFPWLGQSVADLENLKSVLLIGSNLRKDQPILNHRVRKAVLSGATAMAISPVDYGLNYPVKHTLSTGVAGMGEALGAVVKALMEHKGERDSGELSKLLASLNVANIHREMARVLQQGTAAILFGTGAMNHPQAATLRALALKLASLSGARLGYLPLGGNGAGAWLAGGIPHRSPGGKGTSYGLHARAMIEGGLKGYLLLGIEPEYDCLDGAQAIAALRQADFVLSLNSYFTDAMGEYAHAVLPIGPFTETSGTLVNVEGRWQSFAAACAPFGSARPGWKVLRILGTLLGASGFEYMSSEEVRDEVRAAVGELKPDNNTSLRWPSSLRGTDASVDVPLYQVDPLVRRAASLQQTGDGLNARQVEEMGRQAVAQAR